MVVDSGVDLFSNGIPFTSVDLRRLAVNYFRFLENCTRGADHSLGCFLPVDVRPNWVMTLKQLEYIGFVSAHFRARLHPQQAKILHSLSCKAIMRRWKHLQSCTFNSLQHSYQQWKWISIFSSKHIYILHLVIWQTLLSKATYNWGVHKAIHLEEAVRQRKCS